MLNLKHVIIITPDGKCRYEPIDKAAELSRLQILVGGLIEKVPKDLIVPFSQGYVAEMIWLCNEEGLIQDLPKNKASKNGVIRGNIVGVPKRFFK